jgi:CubicO group peptidase (beta-lactamase class C family)
MLRQTIILSLGIAFYESCAENNFSADCECQYSGKRDTIAVSLPSLEGMDSLKLAEGGQLASESGYTYGLLVSRNGGIVYEAYFNGKTDRDSFSVRSVTKSVIGALVGIAIKNGRIENEGKNLKDFFPEYFDTITDPHKRSITIKHLLTMTSGFQWHEASDRLYGDYVQSAILLPMSGPPGTMFNYNSSNAHLLSGIITKTVKQSTMKFAKKNLFDPMGIRIKKWDQDPQGYYLGGTGLYLGLRDMAKLGLMYLNDGCYAGQAIMCSEWVELSRMDHIPGDQTNYGYLWWIMNAGGHTVYYAYGYGGQMIYVVKDLELVVVFTADPNVNAATAQNTRNLADEILINYIIPAASQNL